MLFKRFTVGFAAAFFGGAILLWIGSQAIGNGLPLVTYNASPSMETGFYSQSIDQDILIGDLVSFPVPPRGLAYLRANGLNYKRMIKRVRAITGDKVCLENGAVSINGVIVEKLPSSVPNEYREWPEPCRLIVDGKLFVLGDNNTNTLSFDSRFFGLVDLKKARRYIKVF